MQVPTYHQLSHIDGTTDSIRGPVQFRTTYNEQYDIISALYAWNIHKLVLIESYWGSSGTRHISLEMNLNSFQIQHFQMPYMNSSTFQPAYSVSSDTIWLARSVDSRDSVGNLIVRAYTTLQALGADSLWVTTDTISNTLLPRNHSTTEYYYAITSTNNEIAIVWGDTGVVRHPYNSVSNKPTFSLPSEQFLLYPNPTNGMFYLEHLQGDIHWRLFNIVGSEVLSGFIPHGTKRISVRLPPNLSSGTYMLNLENRERVPQTMLFQLLK